MKGISSDLVKMRKLVVRYETNRAIKGYCLWIWLKNQTISGVIHNYNLQCDSLIKYLKISRATFYNYLKYAEALGLITRANGNLKLCSWQSAADQLGLPSSEIIIINYDTENPKQKLEHIFDAIEILDNRAFQEKGVSIKLAKNQQIESAFRLYNLQHCLPEVKFNLDNLKKVQKHIFENGSAASIYNTLLNLVNPEFFRNSSSLASARNYKSTRNVTYLKKKLSLAGLAVVIKPVLAVCKYNKNAIQGQERGKKDNFFCYYDPEAREKTWFKPDTILISPTLLKNLEKPCYASAV